MLHKLGIVFIILIGVAFAKEEASQLPFEPTPTLINGEIVDPNDARWQPVVSVRSAGGSGCTATVVGPKVIITAAHCGANGERGSFTYKQTRYNFKYERSPIYPKKDHDLSLGYLDRTFEGPLRDVILLRPNVGDDVTLLGYGCTQIGGGGGSDGKLRIGDSKVIGYSNYDVISQKSGGAALCYGDSGGPSLIDKDSNPKVWGINSKGNIKDKNYNTHLGSPESKSFFIDFTNKHAAMICGFNKTNCQGGGGNDEFKIENPQAILTMKDKPGGHNVEYIKRYSEMLMQYLESGKSVDFPDTTPQETCECGGQEVACNKADIGWCKIGVDDFYCRCD